MKSIYQIEMAAILKQLGVPFEEEFCFCPTRKWRFDFILKPVKTKIAIEINGSIWQKGKHTFGSQYIKDLEKINTAQIMGYIVLQYTPENLTDVARDLKLLKIL